MIPTMTIDRRQLDEIEPGYFYVDASEVGIPPGGMYPAEVEVPGLGNSQTFHFTKFDGNNTAIYRQGFGSVSLHIFND